jgi:hypothetical protein
MQNDGNLVLTDKTRKPLWDSLKKVAGKNFILPQDSFLFSNSGYYFALMQSDGNLVIYSVPPKNGATTNLPVWASGTFNTAAQPYSLIIDNGNMYIDSKAGKLWETKTGQTGLSPYTLELSDAGVLSILDARRKQIWFSNNSPKNLR